MRRFRLIQGSMEQRYCHNSCFIGFDHVTKPYFYLNLHQKWYIISKIIRLNESNLPVPMMYFDYCDILWDIFSSKKLLCLYSTVCVHKMTFLLGLCVCVWGLWFLFSSFSVGVIRILVTDLEVLKKLECGNPIAWK